MTKHKIGETFNFTDEHSHQHRLITKEVQSGDSCEGCYFYEKFENCIDNFPQLGDCLATLRKDERSVIFQEVK